MPSFQTFCFFSLCLIAYTLMSYSLPTKLSGWNPNKAWGGIENYLLKKRIVQSGKGHMFLTIWNSKTETIFHKLAQLGDSSALLSLHYSPGWYPTFPLLPLPPSWSSHCQSTPLTTRPPVKIPLAVIFFDLRRDSKSTLLRLKKQKNKKTWHTEIIDSI